MAAEARVSFAYAALLTGGALGACTGCHRSRGSDGKSGHVETSASQSAAAVAVSAMARAGDVADEEIDASDRITRRASFSVAKMSIRIEDVGMATHFDRWLAPDANSVVINGGFFGGKGEPIGLAMSEGKALSRFSPTLSGGVLWIDDGVAHLTATEDFDAGAVDFAIQCRPRLVVDSRVNIRTDDGRRALRTAICIRAAGTIVELVAATVAPGPSLFKLARELREEGCEQALNLDGGPSTGWAESLDGGRFAFPSSGGVRHILVVQGR